MITTVIAACLLGLAMAGGTWKVSFAETNPTIPTILTLDPATVRVNEPNAFLVITGGPFAVWPGGIYTKIRMTEYGTNVTRWYNPDTGSLTEGYFKTSIALEPIVLDHSAFWDVVVVNHPDTDPDTEVSNHMIFTVGKPKFYLPLITK
jgi:hypothetical protein